MHASAIMHQEKLCMVRRGGQWRVATGVIRRLSIYPISWLCAATNQQLVSEPEVTHERLVVCAGCQNAHARFSISIIIIVLIISTRSIVEQEANNAMHKRPRLGVVAQPHVHSHVWHATRTIHLPHGDTRA